MASNRITYLVIALVAGFVVCSCSKLPMKDFLGVWTVEQVEAHDITSNNDRLVSREAASPCFFVGEQMEFTKTKIIPCPTSTVNLQAYPDFSGTFDYIYDSKGACITIPEVSYLLMTHDPDTGLDSASSITLYEMMYVMSLREDNTLHLSGIRYEYDNLGNTKRCYKADVVLKR